jgi:sigma-E factor negative regulatory protein RseC
METTTGTVNEVRDGIASVRVTTAIGCPRCAAGKGCGAGLLMPDERDTELSVSVPEGATLHQGDTVTLSIAPKYLLRAAFLGYGLPLLGLVAAVGFASLTGFGTSDIAPVFFGTAGLVAGILAGRHFSASAGACEQFTPRLAGPADGRTVG